MRAIEALFDALTAVAVSYNLSRYPEKLIDIKCCSIITCNLQFTIQEVIISFKLIVGIIPISLKVWQLFFSIASKNDVTFKVI